MMNLKACFAPAACAIALISAPAMAGKTMDEDRPSGTVSTSGLDLSSSEGQALLQARIDRKARQICRLGDGPQPASSRRAARKCIATAKASARQQFAALIAEARLGG